MAGSSSSMVARSTVHNVCGAVLKHSARALQHVCACRVSRLQHVMADGPLAGYHSGVSGRGTPPSSACTA